MHYQRWVKYGTLTLPNRRATPDGLCVADGCGSRTRSPGSPYCETHYYRVRRGSVLGLSPIGGFACKHCGAALSRRHHVFCSKRCQIRNFNGTPDERPCAECGKTYQVRGRATVCSLSCRRARDKRQSVEARRAFAATEEGKAYFREKEYLRKARKNAAGYEQFDRHEIFVRDNWKCGLCGKKVKRSAKWPDPQFPTLDHIIPLARGGPHTRVNVQTAHLRCNCAKNKRELGQLRLFG